jgi:hypothetical protein
MSLSLHSFNRRLRRSPEGLARKLDPKVLQHRHQALTERIEMLSQDDLRAALARARAMNGQSRWSRVVALRARSS